MPTYFTVVSDSDTCPHLYISQQPLPNLLVALRSFPYSHVKTSYVFELRVLPKVGSYDPAGCSSLAMVGRINPNDLCEHYRVSLGGAIEDLPQEQAEMELQRARDHLDKVQARVEGKFKQPEETQQREG